MSMMLMVEAMKAKVGNPYKKLVLLKLADCASDTGECFPSYQHIADQCEISRRSVMKYVDELESMGFLWVENRKNGKQNHTNVYHLTISKGAKKGSEPHSLGSEPHSLGGSEPRSPITSNSFEPVNETCIAHEAQHKRADVAKPKKTDTHSADLAALENMGVETQLAKDWLQTRKEKRAGSLTQTVITALQREAEKAGLTVPQAVQVAAERGWARFHASYLHNETQPFAGGTQHKPQPRNNTVPKHENGGWQEWK
nr:MAG TPA: helix-turn-helix domain protein [Caudoviricetes sp.]